MAVKRDSKGRFKKRTSKSRKRNTGKAPASPRRRRAATGRTYQRRAKRTSNPSGGKVLKRALDLALSNFAPRLAGKLAVSWAVMRWGNTMGPGIWGDKKDVTSQYGGAGWSLWNYVLGAGVAFLGGAVGGRIFGKQKAAVFMESIFDDMLQRLAYTEVIGRSDWAKGQFGFDPIPRGYQIDGEGNRWAQFDDTDYEQGMLGLQESNALGALVPAGPLSTGRGAQTPQNTMGHLPGGDPYLLSGNTDPYIGSMTTP